MLSVKSWHVFHKYEVRAGLANLFINYYNHPHHFALNSFQRKEAFLTFKKRFDNQRWVNYGAYMQLLYKWEQNRNYDLSRQVCLLDTFLAWQLFWEYSIISTYFVRIDTIPQLRFSSLEVSASLLLCLLFSFFFIWVFQFLPFKKQKIQFS